jgi:hypothetical protein
VRIGDGAADGTNASQWRRVRYQMIFSPPVLCWVCTCCISDSGVPQNYEVEVGRFPWASHSPLLCTRGLDSVVMVHRRVLCLETQ